MRNTIKFFLFCLLIPLSLFADKIDTFYGPIDVEEPVLLELIDSPAFQRLKSIHQLGVAYYTTHQEEFTRYDHSLGVFALLRAQNCSLNEQIAGLLHDVSHTVFSHVGDWIFAKEDQEKDYQNSIHEQFLIVSGLGDILGKYEIETSAVLPLEELFPALEQDRPNLCADRIDYNIQGAYHQHFITHEEAIEIFHDLQFKEGQWISRKPELMKKLVRHALFMTQECWGGPTTYLSSRWLADAILRGVEIGIFGYDTIHFSTDEVVWNALLSSVDPIVQKKMEMVLMAGHLYTLSNHEDADFIVTSKFRGIDPWILSEGKIVRLLSLDTALADEYFQVEKRMKTGWPIKLRNPEDVQ